MPEHDSRTKLPGSQGSKGWSSQSACQQTMGPRWSPTSAFSPRRRLSQASHKRRPEPTVRGPHRRRNTPDGMPGTEAVSRLETTRREGGAGAGGAATMCALAAEKELKSHRCLNDSNFHPAPR